MMYIILSPVALWLLYACVMSFVGAKARYPQGLPWPTRVLAYPTALLGFTLDFTLNVTLFTLVFLERPRESTISGRVWRLSNSPPSWRQRHALWLRVNLLDPLDPSGTHKG